MGSIRSTRDCDTIMESVISHFSRKEDPLADSVRIAYHLVKPIYEKEIDYSYPIIDSSGKKTSETVPIPYLQYRVNTAHILTENVNARAEYVIASLVGPVIIKRLLFRAAVESVIGEPLYNSTTGLLKGINNSESQRHLTDERIDTAIFNAAIKDILERIKKTLKKSNSQTVYIKNAFKLASLAHENVFRKSGEPYIVHPLTVADILAKVGMESEIVAAAILHDVVEDTDISLAEIADRVSPRVAEYVDSVTSVETNYTVFLQEKQKEGLSIEDISKEEIDKETVCKLISDSNKDESMVYAICIKAADRLHNLMTMDGMSPEKIRNKILETKNYYLPVFRFFGANYFVDAISNQIWRLINEETGYYHTVKEKYEELLKHNQDELLAIESAISNTITTGLPIQLACNGCIPLEAELRKEEFYPEQVFQFAKESILDYNKLRQYISKQTTPLIKINILISGNNGSHDFGNFINNFIKAFHIDADDSGLSILHMSFEEVTERLAIRRFCIEIEDIFHTRVLLHIYAWDDYYRYCFGSNEGIILPVSGSSDPIELIGETIRVFGSKQDDPKTIPAGSTVLDFAFTIHADVCKYALRASINGSQFTEANLMKTLSDGDHVIIEHDADLALTNKDLKPYCRLDWLNGAKLESTRKHLIKWLKQLYENTPSHTDTAL